MVSPIASQLMTKSLYVNVANPLSSATKFHSFILKDGIKSEWLFFAKLRYLQKVNEWTSLAVSKDIKLPVKSTLSSFPILFRLHGSAPTGAFITPPQSTSALRHLLNRYLLVAYRSIPISTKLAIATAIKRSSTQIDHSAHSVLNQLPLGTPPASHARGSGGPPPKPADKLTVESFADSQWWMMSI